MTMAIVLIVLILGSVLFHFLSPWYFTPIASNWGSIDDTISITFWVTGAVFVAVNLFMAYAVIRYRQRKGARAAYQPENKKLEGWLLGVTTVGVAAMLTPGLWAWANIVEAPADAAVTGGWIRLADPEPVDAHVIAALTDAWFPAVFTVTRERVQVPTVDLTIHFRDAPAPVHDWCLTRFVSRHASHGFVEEDGEIWSPDGRLLAQSRQLALMAVAESGGHPAT